MGYYMAGFGMNLPKVGHVSIGGGGNAARAGIGSALAAAPGHIGPGVEPGDDRPPRPRMNPANPRAMRRAMRRIQAFAKGAQGFIRFPHHKRAPTRRSSSSKRRK